MAGPGLLDQLESDAWYPPSRLLGDYRGLGSEQLERLGIRFALAALPRLAEMAARVIAEERSRSVTIVAAWIRSGSIPCTALTR